MDVFLRGRAVANNWIRLLARACFQYKSTGSRFAKHPPRHRQYMELAGSKWGNSFYIDGVVLVKQNLYHSSLIVWSSKGWLPL